MTALISLSSSFIEYFALCTQIIWFGNQVIQFLSSFKKSSDRRVKDNFGLINICLKFGQHVSFFWFLKLCQSDIQSQESNWVLCCWHPCWGWNSSTEVIHDLHEKSMSHSVWIFMVRDDNSRQSIRSDINMTQIFLFFHRYSCSSFSPFDNDFGCELHEFTHTKDTKRREQS